MDEGAQRCQKTEDIYRQRATLTVCYTKFALSHMEDDVNLKITGQLEVEDHKQANSWQLTQKQLLITFQVRSRILYNIS